MTNRNFFTLILLVIFWGCDDGQNNNQEQPEKPDNTSVKTTENIIDSDGYLSVFDESLQQNVISNRMENNLSRFSNLEKTNPQHLFRSAGLAIPTPSGLKLSERFVGFATDFDEDGGASIMILTNPFSMQKTTKGLVSDTIRSGDTKILYTKELKVQGRDAEFYMTVEPVGPPENKTNVAKYILVFGDDEFCWIVTASMKRSLEDKFGEELLTSILNMKISDEPKSPPGEELDYAISPNRLLATSGFVGKLVFTETGIFDVEDNKAPVFQAQKTVVDIDIDDKKSFSRNFITPSPMFGIEMVSSEKNVTIDGMDGYEYMGVGIDHLTKEPLWVYAVILFNEKEAYMMHGWASSDNDDNYIDDFRGLANSLKRKNK